MAYAYAKRTNALTRNLEVEIDNEGGTNYRGAPLTLTVRSKDADGNLLTNDFGTITLSLREGSGADSDDTLYATVGGVALTTVQLAAGSWTSSTVNVAGGSGVDLLQAVRASATGYTTGTSGTFTLTDGVDSYYSNSFNTSSNLRSSASTAQVFAARGEMPSTAIVVLDSGDMSLTSELTAFSSSFANSARSSELLGNSVTYDVTTGDLFCLAQDVGGTATIFRVDVDSGAVVDSVSLSNAKDISIPPAGGSVFAVTDSSLYRYDTATLTLQASQAITTSVIFSVRAYDGGVLLPSFNGSSYSTVRLTRCDPVNCAVAVQVDRAAGDYGAGTSGVCRNVCTDGTNVVLESCVVESGASSYLWPLLLSDLSVTGAVVAISSGCTGLAYATSTGKFYAHLSGGVLAAYTSALVASGSYTNVTYLRSYHSYGYNRNTLAIVGNTAYAMANVDKRVTAVKLAMLGS